jgi:hypothetical protein
MEIKLSIKFHGNYVLSIRNGEDEVTYGGSDQRPRFL